MMPKWMVLAQKVSLRHWLVYKKNLFSNLLPTLSDPIFFVLTFGLGLGSYIQKVQGLDYIHYVAPGLIISPALYTSFYEMSYNCFIRYKYEKIYQAMLTTPISTFDIILGEYFWVFQKGFLFSFLVSLLFYLLGVSSLTLCFVAPFLGAFTAVACGSIALLSCAFLNSINQFQTIFALIINPLFFFSGIFFPLDKVPSSLLSLLELSPVYHSVKISQSLAWNNFNFMDTVHDFLCLILFASIMVPLSFYYFRKKLEL